MDERPPNKSSQEVDYQLLDQLVDDYPDLTDEQILQRYQKLVNTPQVTVALLPEDLNDATKVILASALSEQHHPENTQSQAQYRIDHRIDSGGQSHVYLAHRNDGTYQKTVVIKVLNQSIEGETQKQQLMAEMQILADLKHPNIVTIIDAGIDEKQRPWLMLEYIPGVHIDQFVGKHELSKNQFCNLLVQITKALKYIHQNQVVHADIKPANILVAMDEQQPQPVIIDFGIASTDHNKPDNTPYIFATPAFASPEQLDSKISKVDHRSDIYAVGQLMNHLIKVHLKSHPKSTWVNQDLTAVIEHCIQHLPADRYQDVESIQQDLIHFSQDEAVSVAPSSISKSLTRKAKKFKLQLFALLIISTMTVVLIKHSVQQTQQNQALLQGAQNSQYYWQKADEISSQSRLIYALPMRNIEPDFKLLHLKFDGLYEQLSNEPIATQNMVYSSVADAAISLGRFNQAQELLLNAYASQPDLPEIKFKLAKNYLILYQKEVQSLQNFSQASQRIEQRQRLQNKFFKPALQLFETIDDTDHDDQLIPSLIHYFSGEYAMALQQLSLTESQFLWPIERLLLAAQITQDQANQLLLDAQTDTAVALLNQSHELLTQAKQIARSHPEVHKQLCLTQSQLQQANPKSPSTTITSCDQFLTVLPHTADALLVAADAYAQLAKSSIDRGQSPQPIIQRSQTILDHSWRNESDVHYAHAEQIKGHLLSTLGKWQLYSNQEFLTSFNQAIKHHQQAVDIQPNNYSMQLDLATAWYNLANNSKYSKQQTDTYFIKTTDLLSTLTQHADSTEFLPVMLVRVFTDHAYIRYQNGQSADQQLTLADQWVQKAQTEFPDSLYAQLAVATLYWTYSDYLAMQGKNPQPYLKQSVEAFEHVIESENSVWNNRYNQISAMLSGITYYLDQKEDQTDQLLSVENKLKILQTEVSESINLDSHWGYFHNMVAINQLNLQQNPQINLAKAWKHNVACADSPIDGYVCYAQMAQSLVTETKWNLKHPESLINYHKAYLKKLQQGLNKHPNQYQLLAKYGQYLMLNAQSKITQNSTIEQLNTAKTYLNTALTGNSLLHGKYAKYLEQASAEIDRMTQN